MIDPGDDATNIEDDVFKILNRQVYINAIDSLNFALRPESKTFRLEKTVIGFDANVFLRLSSHRRSEDIIDFLRTSFNGSIILPGQTIQEFWNNQFQAVDSLASSIKKKHDALKTEIMKIDVSYSDFSRRFLEIIDSFRENYGYIYDENTLRRTRLFVDLLKQKSLVPYAPRSIFSEAATVRKRTKTPPGFKDDGDGDFFVWVDFLFGLRTLRANAVDFELAALVSLDQKLDWSREGVPHPILAAEINALTGASFEIWNIDTLARRLLD